MRGYLPDAIKLIDQKKYREGQAKIYQGSEDYFKKIQGSLNPFPTGDTALLIVLYKHMAKELERGYPEAAEFAKQLEKTVPLQPIEFQQGKEPIINKIFRRKKYD